MAFETETSRLSYFTTFGEACTVTGVSQYCIFDEPYLELLEVSTKVPVILVSSLINSAVTYGDQVIITGQNFTGTVREIQPDGAGMTELLLNRD